MLNDILGWHLIYLQNLSCLSSNANIELRLTHEKVNVVGLKGLYQFMYFLFGDQNISKFERGTNSYFIFKFKDKIIFNPIIFN